MNEEMIIQAEKEIAEFVGKDVLVTTKGRKQNVSFMVKASAVGEYLEKGYRVYMPYNTSWDLNMEAMQKIRELGYRIEITISVGCDVRIIKLGGTPDDNLNIVAYSNPLTCVFTAVHQFVTWYKKEKDGK